MQCNIDQRGRRLRRVGGVLTLVAGAAVFALAHGSAVALAISILFVLAGVFQLYEAARGWCALRAMGIRTPW